MKNKLELYINSFTKNFKFLGKIFFLGYALFIIAIFIVTVATYFLITEFLGLFVSLFLPIENLSTGIYFILGLLTEIILIIGIYIKIKIVPKMDLVTKEMETIELSNKNKGSFHFSYKNSLEEFEEIKTDCSNFKDLLEEIKVFMNANGYPSLEIKIFNKNKKIGFCKVDFYTTEKEFIKNIKYILDEKEEYMKYYY